MASKVSPADKLRKLLENDELLVMPCCFDALSAKMIERAGFPIIFMSGFGVSAVHGFPDTQLISYKEMLDTATEVCAALKEIPCIGDGDTGYGNAVNVKRTVRGYAQAGMAAVMIEDQVSPKKCGHTKGKSVVSREEAYARVQAAVDARNEGADILILARTDARGTHGLEEAIERCKEFRRIGADITFLEAPRSEEEMTRYCREVDGPKLANLIEYGLTPVLSHEKLRAMGYKIAAYPLTLLNANILAMKKALEGLKHGEVDRSLLLDFEEVKEVVGFYDYYKEEDRYKTS